MAIIKIEYGRINIRINNEKLYQIVKVEKFNKKTPFSEVFRGEDCYVHLPFEDDTFKSNFQIVRVRNKNGQHKS